MYLDTSTPTLVLRLDDKEYRQEFGYKLAEGLYQFIHDRMVESGHDWPDISEITFFSGPGSFTGLRIGATAVNAIADSYNIPLFDHHGKKHKIIIPNYGRPARITPPKK